MEVFEALERNSPSSRNSEANYPTSLFFWMLFIEEIKLLTLIHLYNDIQL